MQRLVLNHSADKIASVAHKDISQQLKSKIDNLKLNFFDLEKGGVNYKGMKDSDAFVDYKAVARDLALLDIEGLTTREAKLGFWINVYNALVVHGVLELNISKSVKEVPSFFKAVCYNVGGLMSSVWMILNMAFSGETRRSIFYRLSLFPAVTRARNSFSKRLSREYTSH
jgi:hypothetical protein